MGLGRLENQFSKGLKLIDVITETELWLEEGQSDSKMLRFQVIQVGFWTEAEAAQPGWKWRTGGGVGEQNMRANEASG